VRLYSRRSLTTLLAVVACTLPRPREPAATQLVRTDRQVYRATVTPGAVEFTVVTTLTNRTRDTLFVHPCQQHPPFPPVVRLERRTGDGEWRTVWGPACFQVLLLEPPRITPGESRTDTIRVFGSLKPNEYPGFPPGPVAGTYRLGYRDVYRTWHARHPDRRRRSFGELLPDSLLVSNEFAVVQ
jgi:hypothetical protein